MKQLFSWVAVALLSLSALFTACDEVTEPTIYDNWQERNEAFIDSISALTGNVTVATIAVLKIISGRYEAAYKIAWVVLVLSVPMFGAVMYLLYGGNKIDIRSRKKMHQQEACMRTSMGSVTLETSGDPAVAIPVMERLLARA